MPRTPKTPATVDQPGTATPTPLPLRRCRIRPYPAKHGARLWAETPDAAPFVAVGDTLHVGAFHGVVTSVRRSTGATHVRVLAWDRAYAPAG
jgi:hypothetical protein